MAKQKLTSRIKVGYKKLGLINKILVWLAVLSFIALPIQYILGEKSEQKISDIINSSTLSINENNTLSENRILAAINPKFVSGKCEDAVYLWGEKFPGLTCIKPNYPRNNCTSNPTIENGSVLVDQCDIIYRKINLESNSTGYAINTRFKPLWKTDPISINYIIDVINGQDPERNRISLYVQNGYLKYSIFNNDGNEEHLLKIALKNSAVWNEQDFNTIEIGWFGDRMFLNLNGNNNNKVVGDLNLNLTASDTLLFWGTNVFGDNQANGYFDYIFVRNYVYPEPSWGVWSPEQNINSSK